MVRPESTERGDPDDRTIMRYGERVGGMLIILHFSFECNHIVFQFLLLLIELDNNGFRQETSTMCHLTW